MQQGQSLPLELITSNTGPVLSLSQSVEASSRSDGVSGRASYCLSWKWDFCRWKKEKEKKIRYIVMDAWIWKRTEEYPAVAPPCIWHCLKDALQQINAKRKVQTVLLVQSQHSGVTLQLQSATNPLVQSGLIFLSRVQSQHSHSLILMWTHPPFTLLISHNSLFFF